MKRVALTDGSGRWFDIDKAETFDEETRHDGRNHIPLATGSQWEHERLFRTAGGQWVLEHTSQWQGSRDTYELVSDDAAARWLATNEHEPHAACAEAFAALELS